MKRETKLDRVSASRKLLWTAENRLRVRAELFFFYVCTVHVPIYTEIWPMRMWNHIRTNVMSIRTKEDSFVRMTATSHSYISNLIRTNVCHIRTNELSFVWWPNQPRIRFNLYISLIRYLTLTINITNWLNIIDYRSELHYALTRCLTDPIKLEVAKGCNRQKLTILLI